MAETVTKIKEAISDERLVQYIDVRSNYISAIERWDGIKDYISERLEDDFIEVYSLAAYEDADVLLVIR